VVEKQIEPKVLSPGFERHLSPNESKAYTQFDEELAQVSEELAFEVAFLRFGVRKSRI